MSADEYPDHPVRKSGNESGVEHADHCRVSG